MFRTPTAKDKDFINNMLIKEKEDFVSIVKQRRCKQLEGLTKKQEDDVFVKESFFLADEAVEMGLADKVETFEEFKYRVFYNSKVNEVRIDRGDDIDFGALEFTSRRWSSIKQLLKVENDNIGSIVNSGDTMEMRIDNIVEILGPEINKIIGSWSSVDVQEFVERLGNEIVDDAFERVVRGDSASMDLKGFFDN